MQIFNSFLISALNKLNMPNANLVFQIFVYKQRSQQWAPRSPMEFLNKDIWPEQLRIQEFNEFYNLNIKLNI